MSRLPRHRRSAVPRFAATALLGVVVMGIGAVGPASAPTASQLAPVSPGAAGVFGTPQSVRGVTAPERVPQLRADAERDAQWQLRALDVNEAWKQSTGSGVTVAVIDSGVDASHVDLTGQVLPGMDLVTRTGDGRMDPVGHGTTVAGIIAGRNDDNRGVVGIAPGAKILPVRVLDQENRYDDAMVVATAVRWAVDSGARVINLSLGGNGTSAALAAALDYAFARDVVVVACTGNISSASPAEVWYPAREPGVLAVTGLEREGGALWSGSITGPQTVVSAPATNLLGAKPGGYWQVQGTSFAAPMVSATAALIRSRWPAMSAPNVINRVLKTARDIGPAGRDDKYGFGTVDPAAAVTANVPLIERNPLDNAPPPGVAGFGAAPGVNEATVPLPNNRGAVGAARVPGVNGWAAQPSEPVPADGGTGWVGITAFAVVASLSALTIVRRFRPS